MFNSPSSFLHFSIIESNRIDNKHHFRGNEIILVEERRENKTKFFLIIDPKPEINTKTINKKLINIFYSETRNFFLYFNVSKNSNNNKKRQNVPINYGISQIFKSWLYYFLIFNCLAKFQFNNFIVDSVISSKYALLLFLMVSLLSFRDLPV